MSEHHSPYLSFPYNLQSLDLICLPWSWKNYSIDCIVALSWKNVEQAPRTGTVWWCSTEDPTWEFGSVVCWLPYIPECIVIGNTYDEKSVLLLLCGEVSIMDSSAVACWYRCVSILKVHDVAMFVIICQRRCGDLKCCYATSERIVWSSINPLGISSRLYGLKLPCSSIQRTVDIELISSSALFIAGSSMNGCPWTS